VSRDLEYVVLPKPLAYCGALESGGLVAVKEHAWRLSQFLREVHTGRTAGVARAAEWLLVASAISDLKLDTARFDDAIFMRLRR